MVTAETCRSSSRTSWSHRSTAPCGRTRRSSDTTFVSRRYIGNQTRSRTLRRCFPPREGTFNSPRASSVKSSSFSVGLAVRLSLCQSAAGTRTAASAPRLVTTCGPSRRQVSSISLKRAFASWTGQARMLMSSCQQTSQITSLYPPTLQGRCGSAGGEALGTRGTSWAVTGKAGALRDRSGGWGGIRTHGDVAATPVFKTGALNRSATHPDVFFHHPPKLTDRRSPCHAIVPAGRPRSTRAAQPAASNRCDPVVHGFETVAVAASIGLALALLVDDLGFGLR